MEELQHPTVPIFLVQPYIQPGTNIEKEDISIGFALEILHNYRMMGGEENFTFQGTKGHCMDIAESYLLACERNMAIRRILPWAFGRARKYWMVLFYYNLHTAYNPLMGIRWDDQCVMFWRSDGSRHCVPWYQIGLPDNIIMSFDRWPKGF